MLVWTQMLALSPFKPFHLLTMNLHVYSLLHYYFYSYIRFKKGLTIFIFSFHLLNTWYPFYPRLDKINIIIILHMMEIISAILTFLLFKWIS